LAETGVTPGVMPSVNAANKNSAVANLTAASLLTK
jgi:hypothetical protein